VTINGSATYNAYDDEDEDYDEDPYAPGLVLPDGTTRPDYPHMPLPGWVESLRDHQVDAIREIIGAFNDGADVVFLDAPVGSGKTLIGDITRRELGVGQAVYICSDKALQDQFARDFPEARVLKGRNNYMTLSGPNRMTAEDCTSEGGDDPCMWCDPRHECPYQQAKAAALNASVAVLNTSYMLAASNFTDSFRKNEFVIADEADLLEKALIGFSEYEVPRWIGKRAKLDYPKKGVHKPTLVKWLRDTTVKAGDWFDAHRLTLELKDRRRVLAFLAETNMVADLLERDIAAAAKHEDDDSDSAYSGRWIREYETDTLKLLPVMIAQYGVKNLWRHGRKWLLMSGTIISSDEMADSLGLPLDYATVNVPSPFPVENRQIVLAPVANVTAKAEDEDYRRLATAVERIVEKHPGRVLVHTHSYRLTKELTSRVRLQHRRVVTYSEARGKSAAMAQYLRTPGAVMFAPSMDRGVDLKGDACECQIITKCPFPYLGDKRVSARLRLPGGQAWYSANTVRDIVQMAGRGVRTPTDVCPTYILDQQFVRNVWNKSKFLFPAYFREAVNERSDIRWLMS
jgi:Rad3-related DNA helicase